MSFLTQRRLLFFGGKVGNKIPDMLVLTIAAENSDGLQRFKRSAKIYGFNVQVLGEGEAEMNDEKKLQILKKEFKKLAALDEDKLVIYTESVDTIFSGPSMRLIEEFERMESEVLVSADGFCWPDQSVDSKFERVERGKRFLNTGIFMGKSGAINRLLSESEETSSLQKLFVFAYLKENTKKKYNLKIDHRSNIFQNLNGATNEIELEFSGKEAYLLNSFTGSVPLVIRGNGHTKSVINTLSSYLARAWNPEDGCRSCWDNMIKIDNVEAADLPRVTLAIFVRNPTPFLEEFLTKIDALSYPKEKLDLYVYNSAAYHDKQLSDWVDGVKGDYSSCRLISASENKKEWHTRNGAIDHCLEKDCEFLFSVDGEAHIDNPFTLKLLIEQNRNVISPMLTRPYKAWSNFWGDITADGFYARSVDYMDIVQYQKRGLWNVPHITAAYLIRRSLMDDPKTRPSFVHKLMDAEMAFCHNLREQGIFMFVSNRIDFGHLVNSEDFETARLNNELWQVFENRWDWERRYIHVNYSQSLKPNQTMEAPCPDVFWFPVFSERFAKEIVEIAEESGKWSDGSHNDPRLSGGYESVPTVDIHMRQLDFEEQWLEILKIFIQPLQLKAFEGYFNDAGPPKAAMNFMVRYRPEEQPALRPHHDTSTYTINIALNRLGEDFEGGGCKFNRYNCSITVPRVGWIFMHPGRLTHLHEGLRVTKGTRYILVSFIDP